MDEEMVILKVENLSLSRKGLQILKDIDLKVKRGDIHCVLGPNGAGKSSLAYVLMGLSDYKPNSGKIYFDGEEITNRPIWQRARLGLTLAWQEPARFEGLKVLDYIKIGAKQGSESEVLQKGLLNLDEYTNRTVDKTLSGGERKRIELASVFSMKPKLAILDEPDSGIDILAFDNLIMLIKDLKSQGTTILLITHREEVARISDKSSLICDGSIVKEGEPSRVSDYYKNRCKPCPRYISQVKGE
jgi:Fe-S cluster assembly ATP-binding protein